MIEMRKGQKALVLNNNQTSHYFLPGTIVRFVKVDTEKNTDGIEKYDGYFIFYGIEQFNNYRIVQSLHPFEFVWLIDNSNQERDEVDG